jgi:hypothetical protein
MRRHDLVGECVFYHPILMNSRFVRERVPADDRFVWLDDDAGELTQ